jgi:hypothetical protein
MFSDRDGLLDAVDALAAAADRCAKLRPRGVLTGQDCLAALESLETVRRLPPAVEHELITELAGLAGPAELGGSLAHVLADRLRISRAAAVLANVINPDGTFAEEDRAHRRGLVVGPQDGDGMSAIRGWLTPELRAGLEAVLAKWAAPGMCDPADQTATIDGPPRAAAAGADGRSSAQRNHDALNAVIRAILASGTLGSHGGLPVSIIVTATLTDLEHRTGVGMTGGGTLLPIGDVIRMARHAHHYLTLFDDTGRPLWLGHTKRLASADQRIVLHATDRGCTYPGCDAPGYLSEVHHVTSWAAGGRTDIDELTFACHTHNDLAEQGWTTRKLPDGTTEWIPPPHLDHGQPRTNNYDHPQRYLTRHDEWQRHARIPRAQLL